MKFSIFLGLIVFFVSCSSQKMIQGTSIEDTEVNRELYRIMQVYNKNLEEKNSDALMEMVSKRYYDNSGTLTSKDDFGYSQLKEILEKRFAQIEDLFQTIRINKIYFNSTENKYYVIYQYNAKFLIHVKNQKQWHKKIDINQMVFIKEGDHFKIVKGL